MMHSRLSPLLSTGITALALVAIHCSATAQIKAPGTVGTPGAATPSGAGNPANKFGARMSERIAKLPDSTGDDAIDTIVAVVNSTPITRGELNRRLGTVERQLTRQNIALPPRRVFERQVLERLILEKAQLELARENNIRIEPAVIDRTVGRIAAQNSMNMVEFRRTVESQGLTFAQFREDIEEELLLQRVRESQVEARIQISESEIDNFIADEKSALAESEQLNIAQILLRLPETASEGERERLRARAEQMLSELRSGADYLKYSAEHSSAPDALTGGALGLKPSEKLPVLFVNAVQKLKPGELTLVRSANGFHILRLIERKVDGGPVSNPVVEQTRARHILMRPSPTMSAAIARQRLADLRQNLIDGTEKFDEAARKFSVDGSASKGGELGWLYPGDTVPEFESAMRELKPGQISDVVESQFGLHIIEVLERKNEQISSERQRALVRQTLRERKSEDAFQDWLRQLRDRTYVEVRLDR